MVVLVSPRASVGLLLHGGNMVQDYSDHPMEFRVVSK